MIERDVTELARDGILLRREAVAAGIDDDQLLRLRRDGVLEHLRHGHYAVGETWRAAGPREQHAMRSVAFLRQYGDSVGLSHGSATVLRGGPDWGIGLDQVHLLKLDGRGGRRRDDLVHHTGRASVSDVRLEGGVWLTDGARTVLDVAGEHGFEAGLVQADWYLHEGLTTKEHLWQTFESRERWPQSLPARLLINCADGRAESVAETLARRLFMKVGIPAPVPQLDVIDSHGRLLGRVDFAWPELRVFGEIDGKVKVTTLLQPGETAAEVLLRAKRRERSIIEVTGWRVFRLEWADLFRPERVERRFWALVRQAA